jgi:hypothetical protein
MTAVVAVVLLALCLLGESPASAAPSHRSPTLHTAATNANRTLLTANPGGASHLLNHDFSSSVAVSRSPEHADPDSSFGDTRILVALVVACPAQQYREPPFVLENGVRPRRCRRGPGERE